MRRPVGAIVCVTVPGCRSMVACHVSTGKLHFVKFETSKIGQAIDFIEAKGLHRTLGAEGTSRQVRVMATGGGAYKYDEIFKASGSTLSGIEICACVCLSACLAMLDAWHAVAGQIGVMGDFLLPQERLGVKLENEDEMECLVSGCNFLLTAIRHEAFTFENGQTSYITSNGVADSHCMAAPDGRASHPWHAGACRL
jgi:bifunctional damage-control phosphatase, subfamily II, fusion protein